MKNIIVPIDFSEDSLKGLDLALLFSQKAYTNIQLVYVQKKSHYAYPGAIVKEEIREAEGRFQQILETYLPRLGNDSRLRYIVKKGKVYEEVVSQADSYKDAIICCSTHGASGFEELFIGSNAFRIISATERPVFTITKGDAPKNFKKIILPIDVTPQTRQKLPLTTTIAQLFNAEVHVVSVSASRSKQAQSRLRAYSKQVSDYLKGAGVPIITDSVVGDNITDITLNYANAVQADLISIMTEQETSLSNLLLGSYAHQMLNNSHIPVLSVTPSEMRVSGSFRTFG